LQIINFANKDQCCCSLPAQKNHALQSWNPPKAFNPKAKSFESNPDSDLNVCQASILWKLGTHLNPNLSPAKSVSGKPPKSFMSISFDSPSQSQVPNLIQYCSWDAVTAHSKRARIHIWRKKSGNIFWQNFVNFIAHMAGQERSFCTPLVKW